MMNRIQIPRKSQPIIFVVSTGDSMVAENKMEQVNVAINKIIDEVNIRNGKTLDAETFVRVVRYSSSAETVAPLSLGEINFSAGGTSDFGAALEKLGGLLSEKEFVEPPYGLSNPIVIYITDSYPSTSHWREDATSLQENSIYREAVKFAFAIGDQADTFPLLQLINDKEEGLIKVSDTSKVGELIEAIALTAVRDVPSPRNLSHSNRTAFVRRRGLQGELLNALTDSE